GLDHAWFGHERTLDRKPIAWPDGKPIALWITVPLEFFPLDAPAQPFRPLGGLDRGYPDYWSYSNRDYGLRVGIYRIMRVLDQLNRPATAAVTAAVAGRTRAGSAKRWPAAGKSWRAASTWASSIMAACRSSPSGTWYAGRAMSLPKRPANRSAA